VPKIGKETDGQKFPAKDVPQLTVSLIMNLNRM